MSAADQDMPDTPEDAAIAWLIRIHSGEFSRAQKRAFTAWLAVDPAHAIAYEAAAELWADADHLSQDVSSGRIRIAMPRPNRTAHKLQTGFALSLVLCFIVLWPTGLYKRWLADYTTGHEPVSLSLADGSRLSLDSHTAIDIRFEQGQRRVLLYQGAAWFNVAADSSRPFRVETDRVAVTALGTEFIVERSDSGDKIAVTEHAVEVASLIDQAQPPVKIAEGLQIEVSNPSSIHGSIHPFDADRLGSWRTGSLIVENRPLSEVVAELARYSSSWIIITDVNLGQQAVSGSFDIAHPERAIDSLAMALPIRITPVSPLLTLIGPR